MAAQDALLAGWAVGMVVCTLLVVWGGFFAVVSVAGIPMYAAPPHPRRAYRDRLRRG